MHNLPIIDDKHHVYNCTEFICSYKCIKCTYDGSIVRNLVSETHVTETHNGSCAVVVNLFKIVKKN